MTSDEYIPTAEQFDRLEAAVTRLGGDNETLYETVKRHYIAATGEEGREYAADPDSDFDSESIEDLFANLTPEEAEGALTDIEALS